MSHKLVDAFLCIVFQTVCSRKLVNALFDHNWCAYYVKYYLNQQPYQSTKAGRIMRTKLKSNSDYGIIRPATQKNIDSTPKTPHEV